MLAVLLVGLSGVAVGAQEVQDSRDLTGAQTAELRRLSRLVNRVVTTDLPGGDAWLKWNGHFLRAPDGKTYIPFTLTIAESPNGFDEVSLYIRVIAAKDVEAHEDVWRRETGAGVLYNPEADISSRRVADQGAVMASASAANARAIEASITRRRLKTVFEDGHFTATEAAASGEKIVRRAVALNPGDYVLYAAIREYPIPSDGSRLDAKWAVLKQRISVPDLGGDSLTTSSVLLVDAVRPVRVPLSEVEQVRHPYALGAAEVTPAPDTVFGRDEQLSLLLFAYNVATVDGKPDVSVEYRVYRSDLAERLIGTTPPHGAQPRDVAG